MSLHVIEKKKSNVNVKKMKETFLAAFLGGLIEGATLYPLDVFKTRRQVHPELRKLSHLELCRSIWRQEGCMGYFRGMTPFCSQLIMKYMVRLGSFDILKDRVVPYFDAQAKLSTRIFYSSLGCGMIESLLIVNPTDVLKSRVQLKMHKRPWLCLQHLIQREGLLGLWKGASTTILRQSTNQVTTFLGMYYLKTYIWEKQSLMQSFISGFLSGSIGPILNNGMDVVRTRRMTSETQIQKSLFPHMYEIVKKEGFSSLYSGLSLRITRTGLGQAILWTNIYLFAPNMLT